MQSPDRPKGTVGKPSSTKTPREEPPFEHPLLHPMDPGEEPPEGASTLTFLHGASAR